MTSAAVHSVRQPSKQRRSRTGCLTCRKRKKRCDETRPHCGACNRLGLVCEYPVPGLERKNKPRKSSLIPSVAESDKTDNDLKESDSDGSSIRNRSNVKPTTTTNRRRRTSRMSDDNSDSARSNSYDSQIFNQIQNFRFSPENNTKLESSNVNVISSISSVPSSSSSMTLLLDPKLSSPNQNRNGLIRIKDIHEYVQEHDRSYGLFGNDINLSLAEDNELTHDHPSSESSSSDSISGHLSYNDEQELLRILDQEKKSNETYTEKPNENNEFNDNENHYQQTDEIPLNFNVNMHVDMNLHDVGDENSNNDPLIDSVADEIDDVVLSRIMSTTSSASRIEEVDDCDKPKDDDSNILAISPNRSNDFLNLDMLANPATPPTSILTPPPATFLSLRLDEDAQQLFNYFCTRQASIIAVAPNNSFLDEFVPMAMGSDAVLYGIIAWAGFHRDRGHNQDLGYRYLNKAMQSVVADFPRGDITTLAGLLVITSGEICNGDVVHWSKHLSLAAKIINMNGGLKSFLSNKSLQWLAKNFAYHDILAASTSTQRNTHFTSSEYNAFLEGTGGGLDTLLGCAAPLFRILAEISDLAIETHRLYSRVYDSEIGLDTLDYLNSIQKKVAIIENKINVCTPKTASMVSLTPDQVDLQLKFFEVFQLTAKMHLNQSVLRLNASSIQMRCLSRQLYVALDSILGTSVEGGLVFPLFIAGIGCCTPDERADMIDRFHHFYERNLARNIRRARQLLEEVWKRDSEGTRHVHWFGIIESRGWDLCFS